MNVDWDWILRMHFKINTNSKPPEDNGAKDLVLYGVFAVLSETRNHVRQPRRSGSSLVF